MSINRFVILLCRADAGNEICVKSQPVYTFADLVAYEMTGWTDKAIINGNYECKHICLKKGKVYFFDIENKKLLAPLGEYLKILALHENNSSEEV
ncbi:hypothetical protein N7337_07850 [Comamonas aquatica]|uniref:hypothetical protein n=1 Tax=Comamonas aquatica TaxID=225991 RepID=UPI0024468904|nr:hypothetical protein [Comamonas aquatica]MDH0200820.1 hypothetical protein [Comamonas aquatica]